jgi:cobalt/nickel transport system permease protein
MLMRTRSDIRCSSAGSAATREGASPRPLSTNLTARATEYYDCLVRITRRREREMHIPDGFLDSKTAVATGVLAATGLAVALRHARLRIPPRRVPLLGLAAAFVFAAQMINFPVAGGTSGHLIGAVLAGALLGPSAAVIAISAVLLVQCLMFADGGISALGANIFNMGLIGGVGGWLIYQAVRRVVRGLFGCVLAAAFAAWCSTVLAAVACAGELAVSRTVGWSLVLPAMAGVHMLIGGGEALITALVLVGIARTRPDLLQSDTVADAGRSYGTVLAYGVVIALGLALFASPFASQWPDGLDKTAEALGFEVRASAPIVPAPLPDYAMPGIHWSAMSTAIAGAVGTIVVFVLAWLVARALVPNVKREPPAAPRPAQ